MVRSLVFVRTFMAAGYRLTDRQAIVCDTRFSSGTIRWFQRLGFLRKRYIRCRSIWTDRSICCESIGPITSTATRRALALVAGELIRKGHR